MLLLLTYEKISMFWIKEGCYDFIRSLVYWKGKNEGYREKNERRKGQKGQF